MIPIVEQRFREWTVRKDTLEARKCIFRKIRDIPYGIRHGLITPQTYYKILSLNKGSCTPKHLLLARMYQELGIMTLLAVYPFRWSDFEIDYPPSLKKKAKMLPVSHHLACRAEIEGQLVLVDATIDLPLKALGLPVNEHWDGESDTLLPLTPVGEEQIYHPLEAVNMEASVDETHLSFYEALNQWLEEVRVSNDP